MRASVGAAWAGLPREWRHRGPGQARRADVKQAAAVCAGEFATFAMGVSAREFRVTQILLGSLIPV